MRACKFVVIAFTLYGCASLEPAGGALSTFVYSPYAPAGQPNPMRIEVDTTSHAMSPSPELPIAGPLPAPNVDVHPLRPSIRHLSGPVRICKWGMSVDVLGNEKAFEDNPSVSINGDGFRFTVEGWSHEFPRDQAYIKHAGHVSLPDGREAELFALAQSDPTYPRFAYVFGGGPNSLFAEWSVRSADFDGSKKDFTWLSRAKFGDAARTACTVGKRS